MTGTAQSLPSPQDPPSVAVVILNWNGRAFLEKFLPSVSASTYPNLKLVVADNKSSDDSVEFLRTNYPSVHVIINPDNGGFARGYNISLRQLQADYYVLLNSDVEVTPGWIEPVIELMQSDKMVAACQPKIMSYHDKTKFEYAGACGGWIDNFGYPFARGRLFDHCETDNGQYNQPEPCFWASGAAMFVRAQVFREMQGFDEFFFAHQEEVDLCWRMQRAGYKIFVQPLSVVYHVGGGTLPKGNKRKTFLNFRNNLVMMYKNLSVSQRLLKIPFRVLLDIISAFKELAAGDTGYFMAVMNAHYGFIKWILFNQQKSVFQKGINIKLSGWYAGSIVWEYFIRGKTTFLEIVKAK